MNSVSLSSFIKNSNYWTKRAGVRWQLFLGIVIFWLASSWLRNEYGQDDSNVWLVMRQFIQLVQWTLIILFSLSLISALLTWGYFLTVVRNNRIHLQVKLGDGHKAEAGWVPFTILIQGPALRPMLGTIQARLMFSEKRLSERIILNTNIARPRHWWRQAVKGTGETQLHDRGIYDVENVLVLFCDMLGLVSLPCTIPFNKQLYTLPLPQEARQIKAQPNSTEEQIHRIEIPKRVEGEHVNYKEFESGDNIHRIVWKIYAKSGQLVVRIPETKDPYASHLYLYVSYFHGYTLQRGSFEKELLNVYKDDVRNLFEALQHNGYNVKMPHDQEIPKLSGVEEKKNELFQITVASWQHEVAPTAYVNTNKAAFVCLSSLTPASEIETLIRNLPENIPVMVVKLSDAIPSPFKIRFRDMLFRPEKKPTDKLRRPWLVSPLRRTLMKNENEIKLVLQQRGNAWLTDDIAFEK